MERRLAAILAADVVGYSRLMALDEAATLATLARYRKTIGELIEQRGGASWARPATASSRNFRV